MTGDAAHSALVEQLVAARLLASDGDTIEIAHESLAVAWPRLRSWLDEDVDGLRIMRHLSVAAESWDELGRPDSELYRGTRQARAAEWQLRAAPSLTTEERDFLDASAELAEREQRATEEQVRRERRLNQRLRLGLAATATFLAVAIVLGTIAKTSADRADREAATASQQARAADARRLGAEAIRSDDLDPSLLLAAASTTLENSPATHFALAQVLDRAPQLIGTARSGGGFISLSLRPDGEALAAAEPLGGLAIFDARSLAEVARNDDVPTRAVRFSPDGRYLVASANPYTPWGARHVDRLPLRLLDPRTAQLLPTQLGGIPPGRVLHESFAFSPDGRWLAAGFIHPREADGRTFFRLWNTADLTHTVAAFVRSLHLEPATCRQQRRPAGLRHLGHGRPRVRHLVRAAGGLDLAPDPSGFVLSPDGSRLALRDGRSILLLDTQRLTTLATLAEEGQVEDALALRRMESGWRTSWTGRPWSVPSTPPRSRHPLPDG